MFTSRKSSYKVPPTIITDRFLSQEARRTKALEDQKRRRAERIDSSRQLDRFSDLNLGESDEENITKDDTQFTPASVAPHASILLPPVAEDQPVTLVSKSPKDGSRKPKKKKKNKSAKWSDKCMYAELLEMSADAPWSEVPGDGLPADLENGWVAVGPVPVGKRCLAVTHQSSGLAGVVPNTTLRSRLLGKVLIQRFPSAIPPLTILDCILDANWRENGILHVLDVVKWKGQDISDCETSFRFWWRDTRLAELNQSDPPASSLSRSEGQGQIRYYFPYPVTFLPVPYHTDTSLSTLYTQIIPMARLFRSIPIVIPVLPTATSVVAEAGMDVDKTSTPREPPTLISVCANVAPDGLLLYVAEASFEAGTSPLSSWIPITGDGDTLASPGSPLDLFQRLVHGRLLRQDCHTFNSETPIDVDM